MKQQIVKQPISRRNTLCVSRRSYNLMPQLCGIKLCLFIWYAITSNVVIVWYKRKNQRNPITMPQHHATFLVLVCLCRKTKKTEILIIVPGISSSYNQSETDVIRRRSPADRTTEVKADFHGKFCHYLYYKTVAIRSIAILNLSIDAA